MNDSSDANHSLCAGHALIQRPNPNLRPVLHVRLSWMSNDLFAELAQVRVQDKVAALSIELPRTQSLTGLYAWPSEPIMLDLLAVCAAARRDLLEWLGKGFSIASVLRSAFEADQLSVGMGVCLHGDAQPVVEEVRKRAQQPRVYTVPLPASWTVFPKPDWEVTPRPRTSKAVKRQP